jgi:hypothetical protein
MMLASRTDSGWEKNLVPFIKDPMLVVWEAMNLLAELSVYPDAPDVSKMLVKAETALFDLVSALAQRADNSGSTSSPAGVIPH